MNTSLIAFKPDKTMRLRQHVKRALLALIVLFLAAFAFLFITFFAVPEIYHQLRWQAFASPFLNYPLPPQTTEIGWARAIGNLGGNGNNCYYRATRLLATELSLDEIEAYYHDVSFPAVEPGKSGMGTLLERSGQIEVTVRLTDIIIVGDTRRFLQVETEIFDGPYPPIGFQCS
jgi:hypothetical protein